MGAAAAVWARVLLPQVLCAPLPARPGAPAPPAVHKLGAAGAVAALKCAHGLSAVLLSRHEAADDLSSCAPGFVPASVWYYPGGVEAWGCRWPERLRSDLLPFHVIPQLQWGKSESLTALWCTPPEEGRGAFLSCRLAPRRCNLQAPAALCKMTAGHLQPAGPGSQP